MKIEDNIMNEEIYEKIERILIKPEIVTIESEDWFNGIEKVIKSGKNGKKEIVTRNGKSSETIIEEPITEIKVIGTNENYFDFTVKGNAKKFKKIQEKMDKLFNKFEKSIKNTKQLGKEGYNPGDHSEFIQKANKFRQSVNVFIQRIEKKEKASHSSVSDSFFAQTEEGTPENVLANFNEVIKEHNKLLAKKTKK